MHEIEQAMVDRLEAKKAIRENGVTIRMTFPGDAQESHLHISKGKGKWMELPLSDFEESDGLLESIIKDFDRQWKIYIGQNTE